MTAVGIFFHWGNMLYYGMPRVIIDAPAKLNLHLHIGDRRSDGFHDIESLFLALAFGDTLCLETISHGTAPPPLEICMDGQLSREDNIISRAVSLFRDRTGYDRALKISVEKRIPLGGGLGGGSSDAAAALLALNRLALPDGEGLVNSAVLAGMGLELGSDVPFFLYDSPAAWVSGRGEHVQPLVLPQTTAGFTYILVNPGFSSSTAHAFRLYDRYRQPVSQSLYLCPEKVCLELFDHPRKWSFYNNFLPALNTAARENPACSEYNAYQEIISVLYELGADFAGLSGSGSTCFGLFSISDKAVLANEFLCKRWPFIIITYPLARRAIQYYN